MTRLRSLAIAIVVLALSAGAAFAFSNLPDAASDGLGKASQMSGKDLPARPADVPPVDLPDAVPQSQTLSAEDLPDAASHGSYVSTVANGDDPTPDTNRGADVSATAKDNHGQATAAEKKPKNAGKPDSAGKPDDPGPPDSVDLPDAAPDDPGPAADPGKPADPGNPN
jgi:hypothetical protein